MDSYQILFVEDNEPDQMVIREYLTNVNPEEFELTIRDTFEGAKEVLEKNNTDLIILDLNLPDCDSLFGIRYLKRNFPEIPVVVLTGLDDKTVGLEAIREGAQDYLVKGSVNEQEFNKVLNYAIARNRFQKEINVQKELSHSVFDHSPCGITIVNLHGDFIKTNHKFQEMTGYTRHEISRMTISDITHPDDNVATRTVMKDLISGEIDKFSIEKRYIRKDGKVMWANTSGNALYDSSGKPEYLLAIIQDITESKTNHERLRKFMDETDAMIAIFDADLNLLDINEAGLLYTGGLTRNQVIGKQVAVFNPDISEERIEIYRKVIRQREPASFSNKITFPDKNERMISFHCFPLESGCAVICYDISEEWEAKELLKSQAENLEQFAYVAAHDFKAPLSNLNALLQIIKNQSGIKPGFEELFSKAQGSVAKMKDSIDTLNQVLTMKQNIHLEPELLRVSDAVEIVLESIENQILDTNAHITTDFSLGDSIWFPKVHLNNILQNLLTNAIKYRRPDVQPKIHIATNMTGRIVHVSVCDNGKGIDMQRYRKKLFGIFQRFDSEINGKGIGLHITRSILESYGGAISVESMPGYGSTFTVDFAPKPETAESNPGFVAAEAHSYQP